MSAAAPLASPCGSSRPVAGLPARPRLGQRAAAAPSGASASADLHLGSSLDWAAEVTRHTLTMPQVLEHLEQLERIEAAAATRHSAGSATAAAAAAGAQQRRASMAAQRHVSWVEHSTSTADSLMEGMLSEAEESSDEEDVALSALQALPPHLLTRAQQAAIVLSAWEAAAHTKPEGFDSGTQLTMPGLADVAVVSRGGWQRHSWKGVNQDAYLALPLAGGSAACQGCAHAPSCCTAAVAIGVFDGHGRAGQAASAHLRNALASGLLMHNQLALMARPACQRPGGAAAADAAGAAPEEAGAAAEQDEAAALLERCFAAAASTMPSTGEDFSLSGSTAVMCLVQPGSVTAAWAGDSRAVLGLHKGGRYIACALTRDHKPSSPLERARIEGSGGWVMQTLVDGEGRPAGPHRVYLQDSNIPGLAVSRCFGDFVAATAGVTSTPDVTTLVLPLRKQQQQQQQQGAPRGRPSAPPAPGPRSGSKGRGRRHSRGPRQGSAADPQQSAQAQPLQQQQRTQQQRTGQRRPPAHQQRRGQGRQQQAAAASAAAAGHHILIVGSDGLWEFVSNAEAVRIASLCPTAQAAADALALEAQANWAVEFGGAACDDVTVAVAFLPDQS